MNEIIVIESNRNILSAGDAVILIMALKVKGLKDKSREP